MHTSTLPPVAATGLRLRLDDLSDPRIAALLEEHLADMRRVSPPESVHALDLERLKRPEVRFWTAWDAAGELLNFSAIRAIVAIPAAYTSLRCQKIQKSARSSSRSHRRRSQRAGMHRS